MQIIEILLIAIGLAMDAFAVSICKGLSMKKLSWKKAIIIALYFGIFQALMPLIGFFLGKSFENLVVSIDHWIAFALLAFIGANMLKEAFKGEEETTDDISIKTMLLLALATSIDALAVRNNLRIPKNKHTSIHPSHWRNHIPNLHHRSSHRQQIRQQIRKKGPNLRRTNPNSYGNKNFNRAFIFCIVKKACLS